MPVRKTPDGRIIEEKTKPARKGFFRGRTVLSSGRGEGAPAIQDSLDDKTRIVRKGDQSPSQSGSGATQIAGQRPGGGTPGTSAGAATERMDAASPSREVATARMGSENVGAGHRPGHKTQLLGRSHDVEPFLMESEDPVTGWLVVEKGPGRGHAVQVGSGMNAIGRGIDQRISLPFGDTTISAARHCLVSYDPRSRLFALHLGDGANLTYVNGEPVYGTVALSNHATIELGTTCLRFIALCGPDFSWQNDEEG